MNAISRLGSCVISACAVFLVLGASILVRGQSSPDLAKLREQLSMRYQIVALDDGLALVPRQRSDAIKLVEVRNGAIVINGATLTASEARQRLGRDSDLIIQTTYLDAAGQRELARTGSASSSSVPDSGNEPEGAAPQRTQIRSGDEVRLGGSVHVARDELVEGNVVTIGGSADIDGEVSRDVTVVGGSLNLGPEAIVRGDVSVVGGSLNRAPGARIYGKVSEVAMGSQRTLNSRIGPIFPLRTLLFRMGGFMGTLLRMALLILFALVVVVLGGRLVEATAERAASEPLRSGLAGLLAEVLFVPLLILTIVVLAVSIVGIPLLFLVPFAVVLAFIIMLVGFTGVSTVVGRFVSDRLGISKGPYRSVALGVLAVVGITLVAKLVALAGGLVFGVVVAGALAVIGYFAEYVAWTLGTGAVILAWLATRRRGTPTAGAGPTAA